MAMRDLTFEEIATHDKAPEELHGIEEKVFFVRNGKRTGYLAIELSHIPELLEETGEVIGHFRKLDDPDIKFLVLFIEALKRRITPPYLDDKILPKKLERLSRRASDAAATKNPKKLSAVLKESATFASKHVSSLHTILPEIEIMFRDTTNYKIEFPDNKFGTFLDYFNEVLEKTHPRYFINIVKASLRSRENEHGSLQTIHIWIADSRVDTAESVKDEIMAQFTKKYLGSGKTLSYLGYTDGPEAESHITVKELSSGTRLEQF